MISAKKNNFIVELRPSTIRAARISSETAPTVVEDLLEIDLRKQPQVTDDIKNFSGAKGSGYMQASCCIYPDSRTVRQVLVDAQRGKEVDFIVDYLKNNLGVDPDNYSAYCLSPLDGTDVDLSTCNKKNVLLCGTPKSDIVEIQKNLVEAGIYPRRLEIGTVGTIGVLKAATEQSEQAEPALFLEIDSETTTAVIVGPKGVEMARRIDFGSKHIAAALKEEMNLKDDEAAEKILLSRDFDLGSIAPKLLRKLLRELQSSIGFFEVQTGSSVSQLYCLKQGQILPWLETSICDLLNLRPLSINLKEWFEKCGITFASEELSEKMDTTWIGLFSLVLELGKGGAES